MMRSASHAPSMPMIDPDAPTPIDVGRKMQLARLPPTPEMMKIAIHVDVPHMASRSDPILACTYTLNARWMRPACRKMGVMNRQYCPAYLVG